MAITPKPFVVSEKIKKSIYGPKPFIFSHEDLNRHFSAIEFSIDNINDKLGPVREGWELTGTVTDSVTSGTRNITAAISVSAVGGGSVGYVYAKGVKFDFFMGMLSFPAQAITPDDKGFYPWYLFLIAEKKTITFASDPVMSGVNGTSYPTQLPSSDTLLYHNAYVATDTDPDAANIIAALASGYEVICLVATVREDISFAYNSGSDTIVKTREWVFDYNAATLADLLGTLPLTDPDFPSFTFTPEGNPSVMDVLVAMQRYTANKFSKLLAVSDRLDAQVFPKVAGKSLAYVSEPNIFQFPNTYNGAPIYPIRTATYDGLNGHLLANGNSVTTPWGYLELNLTTAGAYDITGIKANATTEYAIGSVIKFQLNLATGVAFNFGGYGGPGYPGFVSNHNHPVIFSPITGPSAAVLTLRKLDAERWLISDYADLVSRRLDGAALRAASNVFSAGNQFNGNTGFRGPVNFWPATPISINNLATAYHMSMLKIGQWDMDAAPSINVPHSLLDRTKILAIAGGIVHSDSGNSFTFPYMTVGGDIELYSTAINDTFIQINRRNTGTFDSADFSSASTLNRGYIWVIHLPL